MTKIVLATSSPHRKEVFKLFGVDFISEASNINENVIDRPTAPQELVLYLARLKANKVSKKYDKEIIIGLDTVGFFQGNVLEKPRSREEAVRTCL